MPRLEAGPSPANVEGADFFQGQVMQRVAGRVIAKSKEPRHSGITSAPQLITTPHALQHLTWHGTGRIPSEVAAVHHSPVQGAL